ncbi:unnamed protein product [Gordionus sp. m RMFG-2023]
MNSWLTNKSKIIVNIKKYKYFDISDVSNVVQAETYLNNLLKMDFEKTKQSPCLKHVIIGDDVLSKLLPRQDIVVLLITNIPFKDRNSFYIIANEYPNKSNN